MAKEDKKKSKSKSKTKTSKSTKDKKLIKSKKHAKLSRSEKKTLKAERKKAVKRDVKNMNFFERRRYKSKLRRDREARRRAEDLATLPKEPVKRFFARLHPKRVFKWWFSWRGQKTILKTIGVLILLAVIGNTAQVGSRYLNDCIVSHPTLKLRLAFLVA